MVKKKRSANSARWLQEHANDHYVQKAKQQGLRSRAWFKLSELQQRDHLLKSGMTVIDLGAAPGGWSHYATTQIGPKGRVIACDLLPMEPITGVDFLQGDFCDPALLDRLLMTLGQGKAQVVLSDMAPNMSGTLAVDQARSMHLVELAFDLCQQVLACGGSLIIKVFQGDGFDIYWRQISTRFQRAKVRKPPASRARSREVYIVASGYKV